MRTFGDVIEAFGGPIKMAAAMDLADITDNLVRQWKYRDSIPPRYWPCIIDKARDLRISGITASVLAALAARKNAA